MMNTNKKIDYKNKQKVKHNLYSQLSFSHSRPVIVILLQLGSFFFCNDINILLTKLITQIWE